MNTMCERIADALRITSASAQTCRAVAVELALHVPGFDRAKFLYLCGFNAA